MKALGSTPRMIPANWKKKKKKEAKKGKKEGPQPQKEHGPEATELKDSEDTWVQQWETGGRAGEEAGPREEQLWKLANSEALLPPGCGEPSRDSRGAVTRSLECVSLPQEYWKLNARQPD